MSNLMDLIDLIVTSLPGENLTAAVADHAMGVRAARGRGDRRLVERAERAVAADPGRAFAFDADGFATLTAAGHTWAAGRFTAVSIGELKTRLAGNPGGRARLWVLDGASIVTDVGSLQATVSPGTLFQAASQFNCLEAPGPSGLVSVAQYLNDGTQGPRASVSAFPATLLRHYAAPGPDGRRFVQQTDGPQVELLADAAGRGIAPNGYLDGTGVADPATVVAALTANFDRIRVGLHESAEVVLGGDWDGGVDPATSDSATSGPRTIAQVFASTIAGKIYDGERAFGREGFRTAARVLLRAAYLGTLLAAASVGCRRVVLTLIGGGVFGNPVDVILDAIRWSLDEADPLLPGPTEVILNGYNLGAVVRDLDAEVMPFVRARGGALFRFDGRGLADVRR